MAKDEVKMGDTCVTCRMIVFDGEYHPYTACVLYRQLGQADKVRSCLDAVRGYERRQSRPAPDLDTLCREVTEKIVPDCLSRTCFIRDCDRKSCWGCDDSNLERARVAAIIRRVVRKLRSLHVVPSIEF